jgi:protein-tyrosine phosphatase
MQRTIDLDGCLNFRDLGGYPTADGRLVRWRVLFRSDGLHHLSERDVTRLRDELRVGEVIDLRSSAEVRNDGQGPLANEPVRFHHLPLFDGGGGEQAQRDPGDMTLADRYFFLAELAKQPIARILTLLAETERPAIYHCAAGKDRTGVVSAIVLSLLGVRDEVIVADYAASRENLDAIIDRLMTSKGYEVMFSALPPDTMHAEPETMISFLRQLNDKYGSIAGYAQDAGVGAPSLDRLRDRLLATPG